MTLKLCQLIKRPLQTTQNLELLYNSRMDKQTKLLLALSQVEGISKLIKDNEYESYFIRNLSAVQSELQRQLTNLTQSTIIKE